jgi:hypothetical protein
MASMEEGIVRTRTCRVTRGRVHFNQIVMTGSPAPEIVVLAAAQHETGLHVWTVAYDELLPHTAPQHANYSETIPSFTLSRPPAYLGDAEFFSKDVFDPDEWDAIPLLNTNAVKRAIRKLLEDLGYV